MAENPSVTVAVTADIKALDAGMRQAEQTVKQTTGNMANAVDRADLGGRFNKQAQIFTRAAGAMTFALRELTSQGLTLQTSFDVIGQSMMMTGNKAVAAIGGAMQVGNALGEMIFQTAEKARQQAEELARLQTESKLREETRDLERQLQILKETDPVRKAELEGQRELARIRREARELEAKGADEAARNYIRAKEILAIEQTRQKVEEARKKDVAKMSQAGLVGSVTTSLGGTFNFALNASMQAIQQISVKQFALQQNIANMMKEIVAYLKGNGVAIT